MLLFEKDKNICKKRLTKPSLSDKIHHVPSGTYALVAQLDRVTDYESVGRGFESLPSHQEKPVHNVYWFFFLSARWKGLEQGGGAQRRKQSHSAALLSLRVSTRRNVYRGSCNRKISWLFCFSGRVCTLLHISCTLYKKAMNSLHRLHSVYFAAQKRIFYAKSTRVSSRRSSASICRMASRIILPVIFVAAGILFSGDACGTAPAVSCR